jgi:putative membrane protein
MKNIKLLTAFVLLFSTVLTVSSCKKDRDNDFQLSNQDFVNRATSSNNFEIAAGNLALTKGVSQEVKAYGQHMVNDHSAVGAEMTALASSKGWSVPTSLMPKEQANLDSLNSATGAAFDALFARKMVVSHQEAIALFETASRANGVPDTDLRTFAAGKLPALRAHLQEATALLDAQTP